MLFLIGTDAGGAPHRNGPSYPIAAPPAGLDGAAIERVRARSLLLAGQAGLCCNPRCAAHCRLVSLVHGPSYVGRLLLQW